MYKRLAIALFMVLSLVVSPFMSSVAQALSTLPYANSLVKIDGNPTVYWVATNGKRYVFPNPRTFYSWFSGADLASVITLSPQQLGSITIGGNVTYRPGVRLIKVTTDPKVYAVARYGVLRWITSEALAVQLYGQNWAQQVDDVPDEFFTNYRTGDAVYTASQFNVQYETGLARSPSDNIPPSGSDPYPPQNPPLSGHVNFSIANTIVGLGDTVNFSANALNVNELAQNMTISIINRTTGQTLRSCSGILPCTHNLYVDSAVINAGSSQNFYARVNSINGRSLNSSDSNVQFRGNTSNASVTISADTTRPTLGQRVNISVNLMGGVDARTGTLAILGPNGSVIQSCPNSSSCYYNFVMDSGNGQVSYAYTGRFTPYSTSIPVNTSPVYIYAPSTQNVYSPATAHTITFSQSAVRPGENFTVTARLTPDSTGSPYYTIRIYDQWNVLQHTCINVRTCVLQQTLSPTTDTSRTYYASAIADTGHSIGSGNATVQVTQPSQSGNARLGNSTVTVGLSSDNTVTTSPHFTVRSGSEIRLSGDIQPAFSNPTGITMKFLTTENTVISSCSNYNNCSITQVMTNTGSLATTYGFKIRLEDTYGAWYESPVTYVIVRPAQEAPNAFITTLITSSPTNVQSGQTFMLKAEAKDYNISLENLAIAWYQEDGALITTCYGRTTCDAGTSYPAISNVRTMRFYVEAWDTLRTRVGNTRSDLHTVTVFPTAQY